MGLDYAFAAWYLYLLTHFIAFFTVFATFCKYGNHLSKNDILYIYKSADYSHLLQFWEKTFQFCLFFAPYGLLPPQSVFLLLMDILLPTVAILLFLQTKCFEIGKIFSNNLHLRNSFLPIIIVPSDIIVPILQSGL